MIFRIPLFYLVLLSSVLELSPRACGELGTILQKEAAAGVVTPC